MDKSEEQIAKDKEAVARMIGAKSAMEAAQRRIELLERKLKEATDTGTKLCAYVSESLYEYRSEKSVKAVYKEAFAKLAAAL